MKFAILGIVVFRLVLITFVDTAYSQVNERTTTTEPLPIKNSDSKKTIKDVTVIVRNRPNVERSNPKIKTITSKGDFGKPDITDKDGKPIKFDSGSVKFDEGNIKPGDDTTVIMEIEHNSGAGYVFAYSYSFVEKKKARGTSPKNGFFIFNTAVFGGHTGTNFASIDIPANEWGYFYQFDRNLLFSESPDHFEINLGVCRPTSFGVLNNTWSVSMLLDDIPEIIVDPENPAVVELVVTDDMETENLTCIPGIAPDAWFFFDGKMIAMYSTLFNVNDVSSVLWFTSPLGPELGGPFGLDAENALLFSGGTLLFTNGVIAPSGESTAIELVSFTAEVGADGTVTQTWETATEVDSAGFNLYRSRRKNGVYKKINNALIPAKGDVVSGASYRFVDKPCKGTFYYKLEEVDSNGISTMHGPEKVRVRSKHLSKKARH